MTRDHSKFPAPEVTAGAVPVAETLELELEPVTVGLVGDEEEEVVVGVVGVGNESEELLFARLQNCCARVSAVLSSVGQGQGNLISHDSERARPVLARRSRSLSYRTSTNAKIDWQLTYYKSSSRPSNWRNWMLPLRPEDIERLQAPSSPLLSPWHSGSQAHWETCSEELVMACRLSLEPERDMATAGK
ncbi:hypothetical protein PLEOSDRAFT_167759 [Pleurotus ostreatus PC15]|uniref:Uncharacterized protein n=1 Tax=Pleurotus ostreatus (strain PC15) TaxID=1137138 RepID=A0A067NWC8_PLEO1|nr:hypothetical protein PLEOSDRAFT_167759 [Pleurotus ostreatus PC15]